MEYFVHFLNVIFLYILVYVCQLVLFVKELLYDKAWSLCDWPLLGRGEGSQAKAPSSFPQREGWVALTGLERDTVLVQMSMAVPDTGDGDLSLCYMLFQ